MMTLYVNVIAGHRTFRYTLLLLPRQPDQRRYWSECQQFYSAPNRGAEYCDDFVCLFVFLSTGEHISGTTCPIYTNFCAYSLLLWLGPLLAVSA